MGDSFLMAGTHVKHSLQEMTRKAEEYESILMSINANLKGELASQNDAFSAINSQYYNCTTALIKGLNEAYEEEKELEAQEDSLWKGVLKEIEGITIEIAASSALTLSKARSKENNITNFGNQLATLLQELTSRYITATKCTDCVGENVKEFLQIIDFVRKGTSEIEAGIAAILRRFEGQREAIDTLLYAECKRIEATITNSDLPLKHSRGMRPFNEDILKGHQISSVADESALWEFHAKSIREAFEDSQAGFERGLQRMNDDFLSQATQLIFGTYLIVGCALLIFIFRTIKWPRLGIIPLCSLLFALFSLFQLQRMMGKTKRDLRYFCKALNGEENAFSKLVALKIGGKRIRIRATSRFFGSVVERDSLISALFHTFVPDSRKLVDEFIEFGETAKGQDEYLHALSIKQGFNKGYPIFSEKSENARNVNEFRMKYLDYEARIQKALRDEGLDKMPDIENKAECKVKVFLPTDLMEKITSHSRDINCSNEILIFPTDLIRGIMRGRMVIPLLLKFINSTEEESAKVFGTFNAKNVLLIDEFISVNWMLSKLCHSHPRSLKKIRDMIAWKNAAGMDLQGKKLRNRNTQKQIIAKLKEAKQTKRDSLQKLLEDGNSKGAIFSHEYSERLQQLIDTSPLLPNIENGLEQVCDKCRREARSMYRLERILLFLIVLAMTSSVWLVKLPHLLLNGLMLMVPCFEFLRIFDI